MRWLICGTSRQLAQNTTTSGQPPQFLDINATVVVTGTNVSITPTCGVTSPPILYGFDADATTLKLHTSNGRVDVFTRQ